MKKIFGFALPPVFAFLLTACSATPPARNPVPYPALGYQPPQAQQVPPSQSATTDVIRSRAAAPLAAINNGYDARLSSFAYPYPVSNFEFQSQGQDLEMAYMDVAGSSSNGKAVVLLHGANFGGSYWRNTIQTLSAQGYRVIVPDQIGFGKSSKPIRYQFSFLTLANNTRRLLQYLNVTRASFIGHSMGGMLATRIALGYPEMVDKLVLVNPIGLENWQVNVPYESIEDAYRRELASTVETHRNYMRTAYFGGNWSAAYDELLAPIAGWINGPDRKLIAWNRTLVSDMIFTQPIVQDLPELRVPTLLVIGQRDRTAPGKSRAPAVIAALLGNYPALGKRAAKLIPGAQLVELPAAGHLPQVDNFNAYMQAVGDFLAKE